MQYEINDLSSQGALRFSKELHEIVVDEPFDFYANFKWARPFGMLFTATAIKQFRKQYLEFPFRITPNSSKDAISYASHMAFFKSISDSITIGKEPGEAIWLQKGRESRVGETRFHGTAVKVSISTDQLRNSQEIISRIAKQGERQAKTIRNAFQKASIPSKGLMDNL
ncbi:hypothetical protein ACTQ4E_05065 [Lawsonibacter sp. LCP25S3_G6]|uniref:hypothetical protein n=1 Tax=unclassified Lawsonibacter TaxID=2617946 RepID=UPI003F989072